ncbi:hypothetical protein M3182_14925 [Mesobacillus maritimus]|uniref:hypothetical protein n=1 Tax=Mesobacillus maritimus TaxID=1643336 RepID=UPI002040CE8E|nr:hypothetical protein [Mesobacillus maritimus]MCM3587029.1 hypothetical protein [Mesobacillus maritimus]
MKKIAILIIALFTGGVMFNSFGGNVSLAGNEQGLRHLIEQQQSIIQKLEGELAESNNQIEELSSTVEELSDLEERLTKLETSTPDSQDYDERLNKLEKDLEYTKVVLKIDGATIQQDIKDMIENIGRQLDWSNGDLRHCENVDPNYCNGDFRLIGQVYEINISNDLYNYMDYISEEELRNQINKLYENKGTEWNKYLKPAGIHVVIKYRGNIVMDTTVQFNS